MSKTVLVTGDSRGLGSTIADCLLEDGCKIVGISRSKTEKVENRKKNYHEKYARIQFDLSKTNSIKELYHDSIKPKGPIYGLVNNAAFAYDELLTNADQKYIAKMFEVNVYASILLSKYMVRDMLLHRTTGSIVHISSVSTVTGYSGLSMYASSKAALEGFSRGLAREWGGRGIRSNCIIPGFMETDMTDGLGDEQRNRIYDRTSLGEPTDRESVARLVLFLLSDSSSSITGETIRVDSGVL